MQCCGSLEAQHLYRNSPVAVPGQVDSIRFHLYRPPRLPERGRKGKIPIRSNADIGRVHSPSRENCVLRLMTHVALLIYRTALPRFPAGVTLPISSRQ